MSILVGLAILVGLLIAWRYWFSDPQRRDMGTVSRRWLDDQERRR